MLIEPKHTKYTREEPTFISPSRGRSTVKITPKKKKTRNQRFVPLEVSKTYVVGNNLIEMTVKTLIGEGSFGRVFRCVFSYATRTRFPGFTVWQMLMPYLEHTVESLVKRVPWYTVGGIRSIGRSKSHCGDILRRVIASGLRIVAAHHSRLLGHKYVILGHLCVFMYISSHVSRLQRHNS
jgi:hypothetical protein